VVVEALSDPRLFEGGLRTRPVSSTRGFTLHRLKPVALTQLSTDQVWSVDLSVDNSRESCARPVQDSAQQTRWLGLVVPKRQARRAVTRNAIKRQIRVLVRRWDRRLPPGIWLVRLRSTFEVERNGSAASAALRHSVRTELLQLFAPVLAPAATNGSHDG
jgi:ribonuclease P protein component